jgi:hypothetical protein
MLARITFSVHGQPGENVIHELKADVYNNNSEPALVSDLCPALYMQIVQPMTRCQLKLMSL